MNAMKTSIPNLEIEFRDDGIIILVQYDSSGNEDAIHLHRLHVEYIAGCLGLPVLNATAATILRRFQAVTDRLAEKVAEEGFRSDLLDGPVGLEHITELDAIVDLAAEFMADFIELTSARRSDDCKQEASL